MGSGKKQEWKPNKRQSEIENEWYFIQFPILTNKYKILFIVKGEDRDTFWLNLTSHNETMEEDFFKSNNGEWKEARVKTE